MEAIRLHSPKVVRFQLASRGQKLYAVGCYIAPANASTIEAVIAAIGQKPCGVYLMVAKEFNVEMAVPCRT